MPCGLKSEHLGEEVERGLGGSWEEVVQGGGLDGREAAQVVAHLRQLDPGERARGGADDREDDVELVEVGRRRELVLVRGEREAGAAWEERVPLLRRQIRLPWARKAQ